MQPSRGSRQPRDVSVSRPAASDCKSVKTALALARAFKVLSAGLPGLLLGALLIAGDVAAQSILEFDRWMQKIEKRSLSVQRNLKRSDADAAIADAREIQALYQLMTEYFVKRGQSQDAVALSRQGVELADQVARSAAASDLDSALGAAITLAKACRDCHRAYKPLD